MKYSISVVIALVLTSCVATSGRLRPFWNPGWSQISFAPAGSELWNVTVDTYLDSAEQSLPGVEILARPIRTQSSAIVRTRDFTNPSGSATLLLSAGEWEIETILPGTYPVKFRLRVQPQKSYRVTVVTTATGEPITVFSQAPAG